MGRAAVAIWLCVLLLVPLGGCSERTVPSGEDFYTQGNYYYSQGQFHGAVENYQHLIDQYPFSPYAEEADLKIGLSYYRQGDYAEAAASLTDFEQMHPTSKRLELAEYYLGMTQFRQMGRADRDQSHTAAALQQFEKLEQRFPETSLAALARERIGICRDLLARHELLIGDFYLDKANYSAAESRLAELVADYPDAPVAPKALYQLAVSLEKEGKKYSAAEAFAALEKHYPASTYAPKGKQGLASLKQPVESEEDPLQLVLIESGFGSSRNDGAQGLAAAPEAGGQAADPAAYGANGLPILKRPATAEASTKTGPATLKDIRLSSADPPMSIILDLTGPVKYDKQLKNGDGYSRLRLHLFKASTAAGLDRHLTFDRSIFRDCDVESDASSTTVTINTEPVSRYAIVPLDDPPRLLVTFTPEAGIPPTSTAANGG